MTLLLASDLFDRTVAAGWGSASSGQAWTTSGGAAGDYNVSGGQGTHTLTSVAVPRTTALAVSSADVEVSARLSPSAVATGSYIAAGLLLRRADASNYLIAELRFNTDQSISLALVQRVAAVNTDLAVVTVPGLQSPGAYYRLKASVVGSAFSGKVWVDGTAEPATTTAYVSTAPAIAGANNPGTRTTLNTGNTNVLPVTVWFDDLTVNAGVTSLGLPYPTSGEVLCGSGSPTTNWLRQLAEAVQTFLLNNVDPAVNAVAPYGGAQRVRVSKDVFTTTGGGVAFDTVEFNAGTPTDLGVYPSGVLLNPGKWLLFAEAVMLPSGDSTFAYVSTGTDSSTFVIDTSLGGASEIYGGGGSVAGFSGNSVGTPASFGYGLTPVFTTGPANVQYAALTAYRLADPS